MNRWPPAPPALATAAALALAPTPPPAPSPVGFTSADGNVGGLTDGCTARRDIRDRSWSPPSDRCSVLTSGGPDRLRTGHRAERRHRRGSRRSWAGQRADARFGARRRMARTMQAGFDPLSDRHRSVSACQGFHERQRLLDVPATATRFPVKGYSMKRLILATSVLAPSWQSAPAPVASGRRLVHLPQWQHRLPLDRRSPALRHHERDWSPPRGPADCPDMTGYGQGISLRPPGPASFVCAGDTAFGGGPPLPYGEFRPAEA